MFFEIILFFLVFGIAAIWNVLALIGLIVSVRWVYLKIKSRNVESQKGSVNTSAQIDSTKSVTSMEIPTTPAVSSQTIKSEEKEITTVVTEKPQSRNSKLDTSNVLLYTGALLVGFAIFIFVAFNWQEYTDTTKSVLILTILASMYALSYLFAQRLEFLRVSNTFLALASISLFLTGLGLWRFLIEGSPLLAFNDFWFIYSILLSIVYLITYINNRMKAYYYIAVLSFYMMLFYSGLALFSNTIYSVAFVALFQIPLYYGLKQFTRKYQVGFITTRIVPMLFNALYTLLIMFVAYASLFKVDSITDHIAIVSALFIPTVFGFLIKDSLNAKVHLVFDGILTPIKLILATRLLFLIPSSTDYQIAMALLFIIGYLITFTSFYQKPSIKQFVTPFTLIAFVLTAVYVWIKPYYEPSLDLTHVFLTYLALTLLAHYKLISTGRDWFRLLLLPFDSIVIFSLIFALQQKFNIDIAQPEIVAIAMLIPTTLYLMNWLLVSKQLFKPQFISFALLSVFLLLLASSSSSFLSITSLILAVGYLIVALAANKSWIIGIPYALVLLAILSLSNYFQLDRELMFIYMILVSGIFGVLIRLESIKFLSIYFEFLSKLNLCVRIFSAILIFFTLFMVGSKGDYALLMYPLITVLILLITSKGSAFRYLAGVGLVYTFWNLIGRSDTPAFANAQLYAFPLVIYSLVLSFQLQVKSLLLNKVFGVFAYTLPMSVALVQSITDPDPFAIYHGLILIVASTSLLVFGTYIKDRTMIFVSLTFLIVELIVRLWYVIVSIPWWVYLGGFGMTLIGLAVWVIYRMSSKQDGVGVHQE